MTKMWNRRAVVLIGDVIKNEGQDDVQWVTYAQPRVGDVRCGFPVFANQLYDPSEPNAQRIAEYNMARVQRGKRYHSKSGAPVNRLSLLLDPMPARRSANG